MVRNTNVHIRLEGNCSTQNGEFIEIILVRSVSLNQVGCVQSEDTIFGLDHEECQSKTNVQQKGVDSSIRYHPFHLYFKTVFLARHIRMAFH